MVVRTGFRDNLKCGFKKMAVNFLTVLPSEVGSLTSSGTWAGL